MRVARTVAASSAALALAAAAAAYAAGPQPTAPPAPPQPQPRATFVVSGHGWGHGIGMSQWGARGYAEHAWSYGQILRHYYPGTQLGPAPRARIRVLVAEHRRKLAISSAKPFRVRDGSGEVHALKPLEVAVDAKLTLPVAGAAKPQPLEGPLTFLPAGAPLRLAGKAYRGTFSVDARAGKVHLIDTLGVDAYVSGVVSLEMPHDWPLEAQKAQAVAARSYALATIARDATLFDVYADVRSQVYGGMAAETPEGAAAVAATAGQVLLYGGQVAETFFHSSSGGRTAPVVSQWPDAKPVPYLVSVADPYDAASPYHDWGPVLFTAKQVAKALKLLRQPTDLAVERDPSGHASEVVATLVDGTQSAVRGPDFRFGLGLRSTNLAIGSLVLVPPAGPLAYGTATQLQGQVRGVRGVTLEQRAPGGVWEPGPAVAPAPDGGFSVSVSPLASTDYRLAFATPAGEEAATQPIRLTVVPLVTLRTTPAGLAGTIEPARAGASVELQPVDTGTPVRTAATDAAGAFVFATPPSGAYRAVALGGTSQTVLVP